MDEIEVNGNDGALNFHAEADDPFAIPPPLDGSLLVNDLGNVADQTEGVNPEDNVDGEQTQDSAEKKKKKRAFKPRVILNEERRKPGYLAETCSCTKLSKIIVRQLDISGIILGIEKKHTTNVPGLLLYHDRLCSKKGIEALKDLCSDVDFKGKGHEVSDLNKLLHRFEHWAQCLMPRWPFDNVVERCEVLGSKSRVKNELKQVRRSEEEILRGEPEDDEEGTGVQVDTTNEENSTEATGQQDVPQEEISSVELNDEQRERIRRNRELAFERRKAKKRRLEEESQTQSQQDNETTDAEQEIPQENSSTEPNLTNIRAENATPEECLEDIIPDEVQEDIAMNGGQNINIDNMNNEVELNDVRENDSNVVSHNNISEKDDSSQVPNNEREQDENDISDEDDEILNRSAFDPNLTSPDERDDSSQVSNMNSERQQDENDISDEDDEILNRSAFDPNPTSPGASLSLDTNNKLNARKDEVLDDHSNSNNKVDDNTAIVKDNRQETDSSSSDNVTADIHSFPLTTEHIDLPNASSTGSPGDAVKEGANTDGNTLDNPTSE